MRPVSNDFLDAIRGSHRINIQARVCAPGQTGVNPNGIDIPIIDGDTVFDWNNDVRATLDLTTDGTRNWPIKATSMFAPYGNEVFVRRGVTYGNGVFEWVSLGYYRIYSAEQEVPPDGPIRITGQDRMSGIVDARLTAPVQFNPGTTYGSIVSQLVTEVFPAAIIEWDDSEEENDIIIRSQIAEEERYAFLNDLVRSRGKIWYWDHRGVLVIKTQPDPTSPVFSVNAGEHGVLVSIKRQLSREGVYNAVVALGEAPDTLAPVRGIAVDNNPNSPTYWNGNFGKVPRFYFSPFITTVAAAQSAARSLLRRALGLPYNVDFSMVPNPALEPLDSILVAYPQESRERSQREETHIIDRLSIPLTAEGPLTAVTREQQLVLIDVQT